MLSVITLAFLLLPVLVHGSADQQDLLCADSYTEFVSASVGSNVSGTHTRNQLYEAFYTPNHHLPYSVMVTFQLVLDNGTRLNLSSDEDCSSELWLWMSSAAFLAAEPTLLNRYLLFTLNYFMEWKPPHVIITTAVAPCTGRISDFFNRMISAVSCVCVCVCVCFHFKPNVWLHVMEIYIMLMLLVTVLSLLAVFRIGKLSKQ